MRKVVNVDLAGRAYQVDEEGYGLLQKYLEGAERQLTKNPDKQEVLADIESALAAKASSSLRNGQTVMRADAIKKAIAEVGPVEPGTDSDQPKAAESQPRRLYLLPQEGKVAGVCSGLAAYVGLGVIPMRLLFVLMIFLTQGFWILVYVLLAIAMPKARTSAEVAEAHGKSVTAHDIAARLKKDVGVGGMKTFDRAISITARVVSRVLVVLTAVAIGLTVTVWAWGIWVVSLGQTALTGNLASFGVVEQLLLICALFVALIVPLFGLMRLFDRISRSGADETQATIMPLGLWLAWGLVAVLLNGFAVASIDPLRSNIAANDGSFQVGNHALCMDESRCADGSDHSEGQRASSPE